LEQVLSLYRDLGDRLGEANALTSLGAVRRLTGDYLGAVQVLDQALSLHRDLGNRNGEAEVLNRRGTVCLKSGDAEQALAHHQRALDLAARWAIHWSRPEPSMERADAPSTGATPQPP
jgi:tetratricopeptide (TPR) repeat protein